MYFFSNFRWKYGFKIIDTSVNDRRRKKLWRNKINIIRLVSTNTFLLLIKQKYFIIYYFNSIQSASSPRRVAVPVLVKDGKPCSGGSNSSQQQSQQQQSQQVNGSNTSLSSSGNNVVLSNDTANTHSPDTAASTLLSTYNNATGHNVTGQMLQQPCNNSLMSNSLAMAYRNQNNFMANSHQQQCGTYLPLQTRAW